MKLSGISVSIIGMCGVVALAMFIFPFIVGNPFVVFRGPDAAEAFYYLGLILFHLLVPAACALALSRRSVSRGTGAGKGLMLGALLAFLLNYVELFFVASGSYCGDGCAIAHIFMAVIINGGSFALGFAVWIVARLRWENRQKSGHK